MKKFSWIAVFVLAFLLICFVGCGNTTSGTPAADNSGSGTTGTPSEPSYVALETPLTLEAIEAGTIALTNPWSTLKYKKNGGDFVNVTASANTITVATGDKIAFYADGSENSVSPNAVIIFKIGCSKDCYVYGNVMSLLSSSNFKNVTSISTEYAFEELFLINTHIKNHTTKNLVLPATTLAEACYEGMFDGCTNLASVTCLATNISAQDCTSLWLNGVAATGTFTKSSSMNRWATNNTSGIPSGWTVQNYSAQ